MLLEDRNRRILPRWRDHRTTVALRELFDSKEYAPVTDRDRDALARRTSEWRTNPTVWHAADLLSSAFVLGVPQEFTEAADFVLQNREEAPAPLVRLAQRVILAPEEPPADVQESDDKNIPKRIHALRKRLHDEPRNAIQWVELARLYTLSGQSERAIKSMSIAVSLAPDNRFVVRAAGRLFYHERDPLRALRVIRAASGVKTDPWLLAAEIAIATASDFPSLLARIGKNRNDDESLSPFERTELSSALGTIELESGKNRHARQLFRRALVSPNENSVAQAEWANRKIGGLEVDQTVTRVPRSFEASAHLAWAGGEWDHAITNGLGWLEDQRFSRQPAVFVSYISSLVEQYERSIGVLRASLKVNPRDPVLINNLAFALASDNQVEEAMSVLRGTDPETASGLSAITLAATRGLVLFRTGVVDLGRKFYELAIRRASGDPKYKFMAELYLAREELLAGVDSAVPTAQGALDDASKSTDPDVVVLVERISSLLRSKRAAGNFAAK